jgi:voltage-gated potassium channel
MSGADESGERPNVTGWNPFESEITAQERRDRLYVIIFGTETPAGRTFDIALLIVILLSVLAVMLESVNAFQARFGTPLRVLEWSFTVAFTIEYSVRIYAARHRLRYIFSFFGLVDFLSLLPSFVGLVLAGTHSLLVIRALRLIRVFRVLKVARMMGEAQNLIDAIKASAAKITVFVGFVLIIVVIIGSAMYLIEGGDNGFTSIPRSMYWAIVTMTTVGYGDIAPSTVLGQAMAAVLMILGYGIIAVPTGIVSAELVGGKEHEHVIKCAACGTVGHAEDAAFCRICGTEL